jgi:hypothetical protein
MPPRAPRLLHLGLLLLYWLGPSAPLELRVASPRQGEPIIASHTDGFLMVFVLDDMGRTRRNCGEWTLSVVESEREIFAGSICSCFSDEHDEELMESCVLKSYFGLPTSAHPTLEIYVVDRAGREIASTVSRHMILVKNDTNFRARLGELERNPEAFAADGVWSGGDLAMAIDELQWFSNLFRSEKRVFSQGGEDGVIAEVFKRFGTLAAMPPVELTRSIHHLNGCQTLGICSLPAG